MIRVYAGPMPEQIVVNEAGSKQSQAVWSSDQ